jgi:ABC-type multidrug transport system permease subunit
MYGIGHYFLARNVTELPELLLIPLINVSIYYFMIGLAPTAQQFFLHYLISVLMGLNGSSLGLFLGSVVLDAKSVSAIMPIVLLPVILFSGFFKNRNELPVWIGWLEYISPNKYSFTAYMNNEVLYKDSLI